MRIRTAKALGSLAMLGAAALIVSGCAAGNTGSPTGEPTEAAELPATAWVRADAAEVQDGGTLRSPSSALPSNFNINQVDGNESDTIDIVEATTGGPFKIEEDGTPVLDENYAISAEITSDDPQVVEIKLNPDAVWEDGTPITVDDYVAFWQAQNGTNEAYIPASHRRLRGHHLDRGGRRPVRHVVTFSSVYADWQACSRSCSPRRSPSDPAAYNDGYRTTAIPSVGSLHDLGHRRDRSDRHARAQPGRGGARRPSSTRILYQAVSQDQQGSSFANSEIDALYISANADLYQTAKTRSDADIQTSGGLTWTHVTMNAKEGPLADVNVRKAVASIVNREQIAASANTPVDAPAVTQGDYIFMPGQKGYEDKALPNDADAGAEVPRGGRLREGGRRLGEGRRGSRADRHGSRRHRDEHPARRAGAGRPR